MFCPNNEIPNSSRILYNMYNERTPCSYTLRWDWLHHPSAHRLYRQTLHLPHREKKELERQGTYWLLYGGGGGGRGKKKGKPVMPIAKKRRIYSLYDQYPLPPPPHPATHIFYLTTLNTRLLPQLFFSSRFADT